MTTFIKRFSDYRHKLSVCWSTVVVCAVVLAYADGFWLTALQGAIGAIERHEPPFTRWLRDATLTLPLVFLAVLLALVCARRFTARSEHGLLRVGAVALLVVLFSTGVGIGQVAASSFRDYQFQQQHLELTHSYGIGAQPQAVDLVGISSSVPYAFYCNLRGTTVDDAVALLEYATLMLHVRALGVASLLLLTTNLVITLILLVFVKDRLWSPHTVVALPAVASVVG